MKKIIGIASVLLVMSNYLQAQAMDRDYRTAIGVKVWDGGGLSIKHFTHEKAALEGIAYFWDDGFRIAGLYEIHGDIGGAPGLRWYVGPGAHIGFYDTDNNDNDNDNDGTDDTYFGIDGVIGLDFKFNKAPINISLDWQPVFEFGEGRGFYGNWGGLGIRYAFGK
jgi:hypothetical protein